MGECAVCVCVGLLSGVLVCEAPVYCICLGVLLMALSTVFLELNKGLLISLVCSNVQAR